MEKLKELWNRWKVQVSVVGGVLVVATAYGTCSYEPPSEEVSSEESVEVEPASTEATTGTTTEATTEVTTGTTTEVTTSSDN